MLVTNQTKNPIKTRIQKTFLGAFLASAALVSPTIFVFFQKSSYKIKEKKKKYLMLKFGPVFLVIFIPSMSL